MSEISKTIVVYKIPISLTKPNPDNRSITPEEIDDMAAALAEAGLLNPIKVYPLDADGQHEVYSGHIRRLGAIQLGWETIDAIITDKTREEAVLEGIWDNRQKGQNWLDDYRDIEALLKVNPNYTNDQLGKKLDKGETYIKRGKRLLRCLNPASRELIKQTLGKTKTSTSRQATTTPETTDPTSRLATTIPETADPTSRLATTSSKKWALTDDVVYALTPLEDPETVLSALKQVIAQQLTEVQAKPWVEWIKAGNPVEAYDPAKITPKAKPAPSTVSATHTPAPTTPVNTAPSHTLSPIPASHPHDLTSDSPLQTPKSKTPAQSSSPTQMSETEQVAWDVALGISVLAKIKAKVKKGERPTFGEALLLAGDKLVHLLIHLTRWVAKNGIRGIFRAVKWVWHTFIESLKLTGLYPIFRAICFLAFFLFAIWFGWMGYHYGWMRPIKIIGSKIPFVSWFIAPSQNQTANVVPSPIPTPIATPVITSLPTAVEAVVSTPTVTNAPKPQAKKRSTSVAATNVQPTTTVKKTDIGGDVLKAVPVGADVAKKLFGL
ncbi:MAG TPA: ParB N-terminal domain-containing protein [bacterium]|jgi:ParB/RepB/Spo0J family partition protein|nr:ParB N-terminal domain-containing protein [bacterium]